MYAKFEVKCDEIGFSRSYSMPIDARGYCHELADNLKNAMEFYSLKVESHKLRQNLEILIKDAVNFTVHAIENQRDLMPPATTVASLLVAKDKLNEVLRFIKENT